MHPTAVILLWLVVLLLFWLARYALGFIVLAIVVLWVVLAPVAGVWAAKDALDSRSQRRARRVNTRLPSSEQHRLFVEYFRSVGCSVIYDIDGTPYVVDLPRKRRQEVLRDVPVPVRLVGVEEHIVLPEAKPSEAGYPDWMSERDRYFVQARMDVRVYMSEFTVGPYISANQFQETEWALHDAAMRTWDEEHGVPVPPEEAGV